MEKTVIELFAGVGGFRVGLNKVERFDKNGKAIENGPWNFVWANQWEPASKSQDAFNCYITRFGEKDASNQDISLVNKKEIPNHTLLTGGFPCQDYSVARSLHDEKGINGKKGVLWWQINDILKAKKPSFVLLENVDRLLKSPAKQRGQSFGVILRCLSDAGYGVQWRVINAAEYGHPQRRRRTFIFAFHKSTNYYKSFNASIKKNDNPILDSMMFSTPFPAKYKPLSKLTTSDISKKSFNDLQDISDKYQFDFQNAGYCMNYQISTQAVIVNEEIKSLTLRECLQTSNIPEFCYNVNIEKFKYLKGSKHINRTAKNGHEYKYSEGAIPFPDYLNAPSRTMLTSEGTTNRSTHLIRVSPHSKYRILTPIECERLDEFPDNWTNTGMSNKRRYFICGNALVTGLISSMGEEINKIIDKE